MPTTQTSPATLPLAAAERASGSGRAHANELGAPMTVVLVDAGDHAVASVVTDGAALAAVETSANRARVAVLSALPTRDLAGAVQPGARPVHQRIGDPRDPLPFVPGSVPVTHADGRVIGAVGGGGGTSGQDDEVAAAAATAFG